MPTSQSNSFPPTLLINFIQHLWICSRVSWPVRAGYPRKEESHSLGSIFRSPYRLRSRCSVRGGRRGTSHPRSSSLWLYQRTLSWLFCKVIFMLSIISKNYIHSDSSPANFRFEAFCDIKMNIFPYLNLNLIT